MSHPCCPSVSGGNRSPGPDSLPHPRRFRWMGLRGESVNNWDPWISSNWLTSALLMEPDAERRRAAVGKILRCLDNFMNGYADDGGCDEGPGYWGRAAASLFDCLELLHAATAGQCNGFTLPLVGEMGLYICRAHIITTGTRTSAMPRRADSRWRSCLPLRQTRGRPTHDGAWRLLRVRKE